MRSNYCYALFNSAVYHLSNNVYLTRVKNLFKKVFLNSLCAMFIAYSLWK